MQKELLKKAQEFLLTIKLKEEELKRQQVQYDIFMSELALHEKGLKWLMDKRSMWLKDILEELENICTLGLKMVFNDDYSLKIEFTENTTKPQCQFFVSKDKQLFNPKFELGGGLIDLLSFVLRPALWSLKRTSPIFILDEPFRNLSTDKQKAAQELICVLVEKLNLQFIIITHERELIDVNNTEVTIHDFSMLEN